MGSEKLAIKVWHQKYLQSRKKNITEKSNTKEIRF